MTPGSKEESEDNDTNNQVTQKTEGDEVLNEAEMQKKVEEREDDGIINLKI